MTHPSLVREGSYALAGKKAMVIEEVTGTQGLVKLSGEVWSARALDENEVIPVGAASKSWRSKALRRSSIHGSFCLERTC